VSLHMLVTSTRYQLTHFRQDILSLKKSGQYPVCQSPQLTCHLKVSTRHRLTLLFMHAGLAIANDT